MGEGSAAQDQKPQYQGTSRPLGFDAARLRLTHAHLPQPLIKKHVLSVPLRKPGRDEWFQVMPNPEWSMQVLGLRVSDGQTTDYVVDPELAPYVEREAIPMLLVTAVSRDGNVFLIPVPLPHPDGTHNIWHRTLLEAIQLAQQGKWIRVFSERGNPGYVALEAPADLGQPQWPEGTFADLLGKALRDRLIDSLDHPVLRRLRGES